MSLAAAPKQIRVFAERLPAGHSATHALSRGDRSHVRFQLRDDEGRVYFAGECQMTVLDHEWTARGETSLEIVLQVPQRFGTPLLPDPRDEEARRLFRAVQPTPGRPRPESSQRGTRGGRR